MSEPVNTPGKVGRWALNTYAALGLVYLFTPILFIVLFSFNQPRGNFNIEWQQFTLDNWKEPFADTTLTNALWVSLKIAAISAVVSTVLGSMIAIALSRYKFNGVGPISFLLVLPLTTPELARTVYSVSEYSSESSSLTLQSSRHSPCPIETSPRSRSP